MAFTGDLEHLPIVDVIQLLHSTKKSGILCIKSRKGESQLVFKDGYIVSANHLNNSVRIGQILIDLNIITPDILEQALKTQADAGSTRRPLVITLVEMGLVKEEDAYKGLEHLIEMTVVEILTWKKGHFVLEVLPTSVADEYRYYPGRLNLEINIDTQSILMDSLRIFDEKVRDGEIVEDDDGESDYDDGLISADDLGLADLDDLGHKAPKVFKGLTEADPCKAHRLKLLELAPALGAEQREDLALYFGKLSTKGQAVPTAPTTGGPSALFLSADRLFSYCLTTACGEAGITTFSASDEQELGAMVNRLQDRTVVIFDSPAATGALPLEKLAPIRQQLQARCPGITTIQLAGTDESSFALQAYREGVKAVLPRPALDQRRESGTDLIRFLDTLPGYLHELSRTKQASPPRLTENLRNSMMKLKNLREVPDIALALLQFTAVIFERAITFIVRDNELVAERGTGIKGGKESGITPALGFRIPLAGAPLFRPAVVDGSVVLGSADDHLATHLYQRIGAPSSTTILILPLRNRGKTIALIYADFGKNQATEVEIALVEMLACQAELVLENALYRKKLEKSPA